MAAGRAADDGRPARPARAHRLLGLHLPELPAHASLREGVAPPLQLARPDGRRRARTRVLVRPRVQQRRASAVREHGIEYPVVLDNDYAIWQAYANRYWPAKYLIDGDGYIRGYHHGEGAYRETEEALQALLRGVASRQILLPGLMDPVRDEDQAGAVCYRVTPELYLGYARGDYRQREGRATRQAGDLHRPRQAHGRHSSTSTATGSCPASTSPAPPARPARARLILPYMSKDVNLVIHPPTYGGAATISVEQDGKPLAAEDAGEDVVAGEHTSIVTVDAPRMYRLVANRDIDRHELTLTHHLRRRRHVRLHLHVVRDPGVTTAAGRLVRKRCPAPHTRARHLQCPSGHARRGLRRSRRPTCGPDRARCPRRGSRLAPRARRCARRC